MHVVLYDFFSASPDPPAWTWLLAPRASRSSTGAVLASALTRKEIAFAAAHATGTPDVVLDKNLEHELKLLYVAVTRARERLWIFESSDATCLAPFRFLQMTGAVKAVQQSGGVRVVKPLF